MRRKRLILLAVLIVAVIAGTVWLCWPAPEPVCQGKELSYWLAGYNMPDFSVKPPRLPSSPSRANADAAIQNMGSSAIPVLMRMLQEPSPTLADRLWSVARKQHFFKIPAAQTDRNFKAYLAMLALGEKASNAVPQLLTILDDDPSPFLQQAIPAIICQIGPSAAPAIPALLRLAAHTNALARNNAIRALGQIRAEPEVVVPVLIKCLDDGETQVRAAAARAVGEYRGEALAAVPALLNLQAKEANNLRARTGVLTETGCVVLPSLNTFKTFGPIDVLPWVTNALDRIETHGLFEPGPIY